MNVAVCVYVSHLGHEPNPTTTHTHPDSYAHVKTSCLELK